MELTQVNNTMKNLYLIILILFLPLLSIGQNDYYSTDSSKYTGVKLIDNAGEIVNSRYCQVKKGDKIIKYSPYKVSEYGFKNGIVYVSREIDIPNSPIRVFLEQLHKGKTSLFYYRWEGIKTFFIEKDSTLIEIPKHSSSKEHFSELLSNITDDNPNFSDASKLVTYKKVPLTNFISRYNQGDLKPFPHFKFGVLFGYGVSKIIIANEQFKGLENLDFKYDGGITFGFFIDNPIHATDFSLHAELYFSKHSYSYNKIINSSEIAYEELKFAANFSTVKVPILIRYTYPLNKIRPFINTGFVMNFYTKNETELYETKIEDGVRKTFNSAFFPLMNSFQLGYEFGAGFEYELNFKKSLFFEIRYHNQLRGGDFELQGTSGVNISLGISF